MATFSVFSGSFSFQMKSSSGKKQEHLPICNTSWDCRARVTPEGFNSDVKSDIVRSFLVVNNNLINIKWYILNTQLVNLNASWGNILD